MAIPKVWRVPLERCTWDFSYVNWWMRRPLLSPNPPAELFQAYGWTVSSTKISTFIGGDVKQLRLKMDWPEEAFGPLVRSPIQISLPESVATGNVRSFLPPLDKRGWFLHLGCEPKRFASFSRFGFGWARPGSFLFDGLEGHFVHGPSGHTIPVSTVAEKMARHLFANKKRFML